MECFSGFDLQNTHVGERGQEFHSQFTDKETKTQRMKFYVSDRPGTEVSGFLTLEFLRSLDCLCSDYGSIHLLINALASLNPGFLICKMRKLKCQPHVFVVCNT